MAAKKNWTVDIEIDEHEGRTRAVARLRLAQTNQLVGVGLARLNPADQDIPEIGDELAVARALSELSHRLLEMSAEHIEESTSQPAHLHL